MNARERVVVIPALLAAILLFLIAATMLSSCQELGLVKAQSVNEKLAYSYVTVTQVRQTASGMLTAKQISVNDAKHVLAITDLARASLDRAKELAAKPETQTLALKELEFANGIVAEVQKYLKEKGTI